MTPSGYCAEPDRGGSIRDVPARVAIELTEWSAVDTPVFDVVVGLDGSAASFAALERAVTIATAEHARLTLVAAAPPPSVLVVLAGVLATATVMHQREQAARACLDEALRRVPSWLPVTTRLSFDPAFSALRSCTTGRDHDLLVIGAARQHGRSRLLRRGLGNRLSRDPTLRLLVVGKPSIRPSEPARSPLPSD